MTAWKLLRSEIWFRRSNFFMSLFAITAAAALFVASPALLDAYRSESQGRLETMRAETDKELAQMQAETDAALATMQEQTAYELLGMQAKANVDISIMDKRTKQIMRDLGFNLRIVHQNTDLTGLLANFESFPMPQSYVQKLADSPEITKIVHLVATVKKLVDIDGAPRLVVGFAPEATQSHVERKPPMGFNIERGKVYLGHLVGEGKQIGETFDLLGKSFEIARILPAHGNRDEDILIAMNLADAQQILQMEDQITEILALGCKCKTLERVEEITAQLELVLPDTKVTEMRVQAIAREEQRNLVTAYHQQAMAMYEEDRAKIAAQELARRQQIIASETARREAVTNQEAEHQAAIAAMLVKLTSFVTPLVILVCAVWLGLLAWSNVRERRTEIGLLRALGKNSSAIATLFLGRAVLLGLLGGLAGSLCGFLLAWWVASDVLLVDPDRFTVSPLILLMALLGGPLLAAMATYIPTLSAVTQDPAIVLMEN
ncbi:FtsX-like permease family protein [Lignipirellula cremea]|uniref:Macrolide transporter ATP-binding /permease protein n=1 Tax=Lignipirellula cremea TaxID=2528010 RepID=A0A518DR05_9BACT|nr:FtsX-like permease family protein [Lignipirellula cremea]QDU94254.1 macrolide transporter ATP-binding /permease protein [Lignipirellula cremea]